VLRGPRPQGPPINIAAGSPKMLGLVARYADEWNWWGWDESLEQISKRMTPIIDGLERACEVTGRDPAEIRRTLDLYSVVPPGFTQDGLEMKQPVSGQAAEIADFILSFEGLGFEEVRCDLTDKSPEAVGAMAEVVEMVHSA
jgi:alkanesulfonate monooxygenase SsuD/methylene tetrahydromethanopterin reductase-like flavin-dependent oxidoreductase (luciferase family)